MASKGLHMAGESLTKSYPRPLRPKEIDLLQTALPEDRPGYRQYRELLSKLVVLGEGRRGAGNLVLGFDGDRPDNTSPLAPVIAYGALQTTRDTFFITVREYVGNQIDVEMVSSHGQEISDHFEEKLRWTYSSWKPGEPSPSTGETMREAQINDQLVLAVAGKEKRILLYDGATGMNHLIPVTNFYNELMLHKSIRDPKIALNSNLFFSDLSKYSDDDLRMSFIAYNKLKRRVTIAETQPAPSAKRVVTFLKTLFKQRA